VLASQEVVETRMGRKVQGVLHWEIVEGSRKGLDISEDWWE
jgi:hypothetical protein